MRLTYEEFLALTDWFKSDLGHAVFEAEKRELEQFLPDYFGYHSVQIGGDARLLQSEKSPIHHRIWVVPEKIIHPVLSTVNSDCESLPFRDDSIDLVIIPHVLEFTRDPQSLLIEIERILIPEGRVVIFGFNPSSMWGIKRLFDKQKQVPWSGSFKGITHLRYWLHQSNLHEETMQTFFFLLPTQNNKRRHQFKFLEALGRMCFPWLGGLYILTAHKQISTMTPLKIKKETFSFVNPKKTIVTPTVRRS